jgi:hypothetical protein
MRQAARDSFLRASAQGEDPLERRTQSKRPKLTLVNAESPSFSALYGPLAGGSDELYGPDVAGSLQAHVVGPSIEEYSNVTIPDAIGRQKRLLGDRNAPWESSPNAPGVLWRASIGLAPSGLANLLRPASSAQSLNTTPQYDEVDRRLMDTFPASDAVGRY